MILLAIVCVSMVATSEILIKREQNYDTVVWDGDCSRINANDRMIGTEKTCICQKIITANEIRTELPGFFYSSADGFGTCLYDYRETGANIFLQPSYSTNIFVLNNISKKNKFLITVGANKMSAEKFSINTKLSIENLRLYKFNRTKPFKTITDNILQLIPKHVQPKEPTANVTEQRYQIKVDLSAIKKFKGDLIQVIFTSKNETSNVQKILGFTVLKIVGNKKYNLDIPQTTTVQPSCNLSIKNSTTIAVQSTLPTHTNTTTTISSTTTVVNSTMTTLSNTIAIPGTSTPVRHNVTSVCNNATAVGPMFTPAPLKETEPDEEKKLQIVIIVLAAIIAILLAVIVALLVKPRFNEKREEKEDKEAVVLADTKDNYFENHSQQSLRIYKPLNSISISTNDTNDDNSYITANDISHPKVCEKVEPIYETSVVAEFNKTSGNSIKNKQNGRGNNGYWYDEVKDA